MTDSLTTKATPEIQRAAEYFKQWTILDPNGAQTDIRPDRRYLLKNNTNRHFLAYKEQNFGINLGFTDDAEPSRAKKVVHWSFVNERRTPVKYGEPVAIRCKDGYLHYGQRPWGINLDWSDTPIYEWRLLGAKPGTVVKTRDWLCIFNTPIRDRPTDDPLQAGSRRRHRLARQQDPAPAGTRLGQRDRPAGRHRVPQEPGRRRQERLKPGRAHSGGGGHRSPPPLTAHGRSA